jgi:MSHA biogenesis protein MshJ
VAHQPKSLLANQPSQNLYRHGFSMRVSGNYQDIYHFLAKAEALPWKFHWQDFQLATVDYPSISLNINIYTLSLKQGFIDL